MNRRIRRIQAEINRSPKIDLGYNWSSGFMCAYPVVIPEKAYRGFRLNYLRREHNRRHESFLKSDRAWEVSIKLDINF